MHPRVGADLLEFIHVIVAPIDNAAKLLRLLNLAEYFLERLIILRIKKGAVVTADERFTFYHKLQIAIALGALEAKTVGALRKLAKLRNRCAHERKPIVEAADLIKIGILLGPSFERAIADFEGEDREFRALAYALFKDLSEKVSPIEIARDALQIR